MEKREAFKMFLKPGFKDEYKKRHAALWPEMRQLLHAHRISEDAGRRRKSGHGKSGGCKALVGVYGGYHGNQPRQLANFHPAARDVPHGLNRLAP